MLLAFFLLTFVVTWTAWTVWAGLGSPRSSFSGGPIFLLGVFAPSLVALVLTRRSEGVPGVTRLLGRPDPRSVTARRAAGALPAAPLPPLAPATMVIERQPKRPRRR